MARTVSEVEQSEIATLVVESNLTDTNESARAAATVGAHARQVVTIEQRVSELQKAFGFGGSGTDLDERCAQMPGFPPRAGSSPASGAVLALTRDDSSGELLVPAGSAVQTSAGVVYVLQSDVFFLDGELQFPATGQHPGFIVASVPGTAGNLPQGAATTIRSMPAGVIACTNTLAITNGLNREEDPALRKRAFDWFSAGLTLLTPNGLLALARSYRSPTSGARVINPVVKSDPSRPYSVIVVPPIGAIRPATATGGVVPDNGQLAAWFNAPVVGNEVTVYVNGIAVPTVQWVSILERGILYLTADADFWEPGDLWEIRGHQVYFDWVAEFQAIIEGMLQFIGQQQGFRATGTRVRVVEATPENIEFSVRIVYVPGVDENQVNQAFRSGIIQYASGLAPGAPVVFSHLSARQERIFGVQDHQFLNTGDPTLALPAALWPAGDTFSLVTNESSITINSVI